MLRLRPHTLALAALTAVTAHAAPAAATPPNIVYLLVDDLGYADVGFTGSKEVRTPNIDRLAAQGAILESHYVQPVCSPTRAAILTGRYPTRTGMYTIVSSGAKWGLERGEHLLPETLRTAGYTTAICGKWHLGEAEAFRPTKRGFDHQYGNILGMIDCFTHKRGGTEDWWRDDRPIREQGYSTHLLADEACKLIAAQPAGKPLFLYLPFNAVHGPVSAPEEYKKPFAAFPAGRRTLLASIAVVDEAVGRVVAALEKKGMRDNTLIVFSSDNGGLRGTNGTLRGAKASIYEGGVRVCAAANWPGHIPAGTVVKAPVHGVDWYPTFAKIAGAKPPADKPLDGLDILPVLTSGAPSPHDAILLMANTPNGAALRMGDWKLLKNASEAASEEGGAAGAEGGDHYELYNLANDRSESRNLAAEQPAKLAEMRARLDAMLKDAVPQTGSDAAPAKGKRKRPGA